MESGRVYRYLGCAAPHSRVRSAIFCIMYKVIGDAERTLPPDGAIVGCFQREHPIYGVIEDGERTLPLAGTERLMA